jgi:hypothetical protein
MLKLELQNADVQIEGLDFQQGLFNGVFDRLALQNCDLRYWTELRSLVTIHSTGRAARFTNCIYGIGPTCQTTAGQTVEFENCILGRLSVDAPPKEAPGELVLRRCLCCALEPMSGTLACDNSPGSELTAHAEDSVFLGGAILTNSANKALWTGARNVYSLTIGFANGLSIYSLDAWRQRWQSDADSVAAPPRYLDPQMWRLLSGHPKRPDGKDYGADLNTLARMLPQ